MTDATQVIVIGGGQAGLATSYCLKQKGIDHIVLDRGRIGDTWRKRWDSFCLVTTNSLCRLPGHPYDGDDPGGFMGRDDIVRYVERYAAKFEPPFHGGVEVARLGRDDDGFVVTTSEGEFRAPKVVVATGTHQHPRTPPCAADLDSSITQLHSSAYRNADGLPRGAILVVGSGQSGCQIVEDLELAGRTVHLAVGKAGRVPRRYRGKDVTLWAERLGLVNLPIHDHPKGEAVRFGPNPHVSGRDGGHTTDLRDFARRGIRLHGHVTGFQGTRAALAPDLAANLDAADEACREITGVIDKIIEAKGIAADPPDLEVHDWQPGPPQTELDLAEAGISTVIWATGFRYDFGWVDLPVFDDRGYPRYERGVTELPGLYFVGLHWMYTQGSGLFYGVGRDAEHIVEHMAAN